MYRYCERRDLLLGSCGWAGDDHVCDDHFHEKVGKLGDDEKTAETIDAMCDTAVRSTYMRLVLLKPLSKLMPRKGDVCEDVLVPRGGLSLHAQGCRRGPLLGAHAAPVSLGTSG